MIENVPSAQIFFRSDFCVKNSWYETWNTQILLMARDPLLWWSNSDLDIFTMEKKVNPPIFHYEGASALDMMFSSLEGTYFK